MLGANVDVIGLPIPGMLETGDWLEARGAQHIIANAQVWHLDKPGGNLHDGISGKTVNYNTPIERVWNK